MNRAQQSSHGRAGTHGSASPKAGCRFGLLLAALAVLLSGCNGYTKKSDAFVDPYRRGEFEAAAVAVSDMCGPVVIAVAVEEDPGLTAASEHDQGQDQDPAAASNSELPRAAYLCTDEVALTDKLKVDKCDHVLARIEQGIVLRYAGRLAESCIAFDHADLLMEKFSEGPAVSVTNNAAAAVTNLSVLDYRGTCYDRIMANVYKALNLMELGQLEAARVELQRAYEGQRDAVALRTEAIEKAAAALQESPVKGSKDYDWKRMQEDSITEDVRSQALQEVGDMSSYAAFANPFAEYVRGVYLLAEPRDTNDQQSALLSMQRVAAMVKDNPYVLEDVTCAERVADGGAACAPVTYVFLESGMAPSRGQIRIDVPIFIVGMAAGKNLGVDYVGASFPKLVPGASGPEELEIRTPERTWKTALLMDMDSVVAAEFKEELPLIITQTLLGTAVKAAAAYGLNVATQGNSVANTTTRILTTLYLIAVNEADLRTWRTLPKRLCVARLETPATREIQIVVPGGQEVTVSLLDAPVNVVYVKAASSEAPLHVRSFSLGSRVASAE